MVCYARPLSLLAAIVIAAWLVFSGPVTHFFATAAILVAVLIVMAAAAAAAAFVVTAALSHRRRRAAAGGCVTARLTCSRPGRSTPATRPAPGRPPGTAAGRASAAQAREPRCGP